MTLVTAHQAKCAICAGVFEARYLQVDHRVPYEVAGDVFEVALDPADFMLLCGSCNRAKSWSCEHCANWQYDKLPALCLTCYWAKPDSYLHIALQAMRRAEVVWGENEIAAYELLKQVASEAQTPIPDYIKQIIQAYLNNSDNPPET